LERFCQEHLPEAFTAPAAPEISLHAQ